MNTPILNREFQHPADGWYQIEPKGDHPNRAAGLVQIIDDEAATAIVNRFNADAAAGQLRHGHEMLIDHEHFSDQPDKETRAYGWLTKLENRADGIYGQIRWTRTGKEAVDGGDYRFFSTEYNPDSLKVLNGKHRASGSGQPARVKPLRLDGLTLTNMHNNRGQRPITNRRPASAEPASPGGRPSSTQSKTMKSVMTLLGLSADASEEAAHAEVLKLKNRAEKAEGELAPIKNRVTELETQNSTLLDEQIDSDLAAAGVKEEKVINRLKPVLQGLKNREERTSFIADVVGSGRAPAPAGSGRTRVLNRADGKTPEGTTTTDDAELAQKAEAEIRNRMVGGRSYTQARNLVRLEKPELFGITRQK